MSDHKFEKKVGQKLDDLKITPSAKSWENIENELRKDKRRPAPIFWLPLLLLGLGAIGYFVFTAGGHKGSSGSIVKTENRPVNDNAGKIVNDNSEKIVNDDAGKIVNENSDKIVKTQRTGKPGVKTYEKKISEHIPPSPSSVAQRPASGQRISPSPPSPLASLGVPPPAEDRSPGITQNEPSVNTPTKPESGARGGTLSPAEGGKDTAQQHIKPEQPDSSTASNKTSSKSKKKKWAFGFSASGGVSSLSEGKLGFNNSQIATVPANRQVYFSNASPAVVPPPAASPSKIYPGFSFSAGLTTKYELSKRFSLSTGINYLQINTISKVGYKIEQSNNGTNNAIEDLDKSVQPLYLPAAPDEQDRDYDNKYHFIEVPVTIHTRINKSSNLPIYWNAGISFSKLLKSNSLYYDEEKRVYYSNDDLLKKMQTAVTTGLSFSVFNKTSRPLWFGPTVRYNLSQALKTDVTEGSKHFMGLGLDVKWFIR